MVHRYSTLQAHCSPPLLPPSPPAAPCVGTPSRSVAHSTITGDSNITLRRRRNRHLTMVHRYFILQVHCSPATESFPPPPCPLQSQPGNHRCSTLPIHCSPAMESFPPSCLPPPRKSHLSLNSVKKNLAGMPKYRSQLNATSIS